MQSMKAKINVTIDKPLLEKVDAAVKTQRFRNRSARKGFPITLGEENYCSN